MYPLCVFATSDVGAMARIRSAQRAASGQRRIDVFVYISSRAVLGFCGSISRNPFVRFERLLPFTLPAFNRCDQAASVCVTQAINEKRSRIAPERDRSPDPSSKYIGRARNDPLQDSVAAEAQFPPRRGLSFSNSRSAHNNGRPPHKPKPAGRERAQNLGRVRWPGCKVARQSCSPPAAYRDFEKFGSHADKGRVRIGVLRRFGGGPLFFLLAKRCPKSVGNFTGQFSLQTERISQSTVVTVCPNCRLFRASINCTFTTIRSPSLRTLPSRMFVTPSFLPIWRRFWCRDVTKPHHRRTTDHSEFFDLCKTRQNIVLDTIGEKSVVFLGAEILEWQHRDAFLLRQQCLLASTGNKARSSNAAAIKRMAATIARYTPRSRRGALMAAALAAFSDCAR